MIQVTMGIGCFIRTYCRLFVQVPGAYKMLADTIKKRIIGEIDNGTGLLLTADRESLDTFSDELTKCAGIDGLSFTVCDPMYKNKEYLQYIIITCDDEECMTVLNMIWG